MSGPPRRSGFVAVVGRPNVGKSTLTNLLVGRKVAIVADVPQTTRTRIQGVRTMPEGQIIVVDTPGIHKPLHEMNRRMVAESAEAMRDVDLILFLIEASEPREGIGGGDRFIAGMLPRDGPPVLLVINKIDRIRKPALLPLIDRARGLHPFREVLLVSALTGENTEELPGIILSYLPEGPDLFPDGQITDQPERQLASETIREKLLHHTRGEIPHETCVLVEAWDTGRPDLLQIDATILVDKESQRKIVIGARGGMLKTVGSEAREEMERWLGTRIMLRLWVKVRPGWREEPSILRRLGMRADG